MLLIKQGELLIEQIREKFTKEKTIVNIGISYRGKVYEVLLNLNEALKKLSAEEQILLRSVFK